MPLSIPEILEFIGRMEAQKEKGLGASPETAPLIIEALRLYARMHAARRSSSTRPRRSSPSRAEAIIALVEQRGVDRSLGVFGEPRVNVLALNLALRHAYPTASGRSKKQIF